MATINGSDRSEIIDGTDRSDIIFGNGGNDAIWGFYGDDQIHGGTGSDLIRAGGGHDDLWGDSGLNDLFGGSGRDVFHTGARLNSFSDDWIGDFQFDADTIDVSSWGISDFSQIKALLKSDFLGSAWLNAYYNGHDHFLTIGGVPPGELIASDFIYSDLGAQSLTGTRYGDTLFGSRSNDLLSGVGGDDALLGGIGNDLLSGGVGQDRLTGGAGADRLNGGTGRDVMTGNVGEDVFIFNDIFDSVAGPDHDLITDFHRNEDVMNLANIDANTTLNGNQVFVWVGAADFSAAGQLRYYFSGGKTIISGSVDGDTVSEFQISLEGRFVPIAGDFVL